MVHAQKTGITKVHPKTWKCCETYFYLKIKPVWYEIKGFDTRRKTLCFLSWKKNRSDFTWRASVCSHGSDVRRVAGMFTTCLHGRMKGGRTKIAAPLILLPHPHACMCCVSESLEIQGSDSSRLQIFKGTAHFPSN